MSVHSYLACDLGAESGRVMLGTFTDGWLGLQQIHRFPNGPFYFDEAQRWELPRIFAEILTGLRKTTAIRAIVDSISVTSWGVDYALIGERESLLALPYHYRDPRTEGSYASVMDAGWTDLIFSETGLQFMPINTLYQLIAERQANPARFELAAKFLPIADYIHFLLSGVLLAERSLASTTQLYNPRTQSWSRPVIDTVRLPERIFPNLVDSATRIGALRAEIAAETGLGSIAVVAGCSHDTAAAVAAVPATGSDWAFISSGTWSLLGVELSAPLISGQVRVRNFTNEAGFDNTTRFLKNIDGLWLLQQARKELAPKEVALDYAALTQEAAGAPALRSLFDASDPRFGQAGDVLEKIATWCTGSGQAAPQTTGEFVRSIFESLALLYARTLAELEHILERPLRVVHIVGGGSQCDLLNQMVANATGRVVIAGPVEATSAGSLLLQAVALGHLKGSGSIRDAVRNVVRTSFPTRRFVPRDTALWVEAARTLGFTLPAPLPAPDPAPPSVEIPPAS